MVCYAICGRQTGDIIENKWEIALIQIQGQDWQTEFWENVNKIMHNLIKHNTAIN